MVSLILLILLSGSKYEIGECFFMIPADPPPPPPGQQIQLSRRPHYHALARDNAEVLNALLTRDIPAMNNQMNHTLGMLNELIRRQLDY